MGNAIVRLGLVLESVHIGIFRMCILYMPLRYLNMDPSEFSRVKDLYEKNLLMYSITVFRK